jgi:hypothetical protein
MADVVLETRRFFSLPIDVPIVATGHQPIIPHPGILAKYFRTRSLADAWGAHASNLVIDTGVERVGDIDVPVGRPPASLSVTTISMLTEHDGVLAFRPPGIVQVPNIPAGLSKSVATGIEMIAAAWDLAIGSTAAAQAIGAVGSLLRPCVGEMSAVFASRLLLSPVGEAMLEAMRSDQEACVRLYNEAVAEYPDAGVRPLRVGESVELPLWRMKGGAIQPAVAQDLDAHPTQLVPRALVTSALTRSAVADHFVHGLGGWSYDRIMEQWMNRWLGWSMCPASLATGTVRLPDCSDHDIAQALHRCQRTVRRLIHDPHRGSTASLSAEKAAMLDEIKSTPVGSPARHAAFTRMHRWLADIRGKADLGTAQVQLAAAKQSAPIARRRTWGFPLYRPKSIGELRSTVESNATSQAIRLAPAS